MKTLFHFPANKLKAAAIFAATKDIRYYLNGVVLQRHGDGMVAVATDGHRLTVIHEANCGLTDGGIPAAGTRPPRKGFSVIVHSDDVARVVKAHGKSDCPVFVEVESTADKAPRTIRFKCDAGAVVIECKELEGKYPDWQRVVPAKPAKEFAPSCFNGDYLADFAKLSRALGNKTHFVTVYANGSGSAVVDIGIEDCICVLMPMRGDEARAHAWYYKPVSAARGSFARLEAIIREMEAQAVMAFAAEEMKIAA